MSWQFSDISAAIIGIHLDTSYISPFLRESALKAVFTHKSQLKIENIYISSAFC